VGSETRTAELLQALAAHLREQRAAMLQAWRQSVDTDPRLPTASTLSTPQFIEHIPKMLDTLEQRLSAESYPEKRRAVEEQKEDAAAHGLQRWQ
jgi:hypothetical protein